MLHHSSQINSTVTLFVRFALLASLLALFQFAAQPEQCRAALVAHWDFEGDLVDNSGNGNHLSLGTGTTAYSGTTPAPFSSQAGSFDGSTRLDQTSPTNFGFTSYTVAGWIKAPLPDATGYHGIFWRGPVGGTDVEFYIQLNSNDFVVAHNRSNSGTFGYAGFADPPDDTYFHLAVTYDGTTVTTYYDGVSQALAQQDALLPVPLVSAGHQVSVGKMNHLLFNPNFHNGLIDELFVYNNVLTLDEINNLMEFNSIDGPVVPEPSSLALLGLGLIVMARRGTKRRLQQSAAV